MTYYPLHVQERFARLLRQRADQSGKEKFASTTDSSKMVRAEDVLCAPRQSSVGEDGRGGELGRLRQSNGAANEMDFRYRSLFLVTGRLWKSERPFLRSAGGMRGKGSHGWF